MFPGFLAGMRPGEHTEIQGVVMIFSKRMMFLNILLLVLSAAVLWVSCDTGNGGNGDEGDD
jgi:hypothetical protein